MKPKSECPEPHFLRQLMVFVDSLGSCVSLSSRCCIASMVATSLSILTHRVLYREGPLASAFLMRKESSPVDTAKS